MSTSNLRPITHWLSQRGTGILLLFTLLLAPVSLVIPFFTILVFWHLYLGIEEIFADYIHSDFLRNFVLILLRILILITVKYVFVYFVL
jgi:succinate dehydrogenase hydrophobic anchor subunit